MLQMSELIKNIGVILQCLWNIIITLLAIYIAIRASIMKQVSKYIAEAEAKDSELTGKEKMKLVVLWIKDLIPRMFRVMFTDKVIELMVQNIYDDMKKYRETFISNKGGK